MARTGSDMPRKTWGLSKGRSGQTVNAAASPCPVWEGGNLNFRQHGCPAVSSFGTPKRFTQGSSGSYQGTALARCVGLQAIVRDTQGLKPLVIEGSCGTAEAVP